MANRSINEVLDSRDLRQSPATAVQVVMPGIDHSLQLNESALEKILLDPKVRDSKVIILSIAGAYRTGKSFLLSFFLRYLYSQGSESWIGDPNAPLEGFKWKNGTERETTGIFMWSYPFEVDLPSGEKAVVLLMDTQGVFDNTTAIKGCATIFALSTLLSSVQIYNIMRIIQENDLQQIEFFMEYGRLASIEASGNEGKSFQELHLLIRDWNYHYKFKYGREGAEKYLEKCLEEKPDQPEELKELRRNIMRSYFVKVKGFLMPDPGDRVTRDEHFDGCPSDIDDDFKTHLTEFFCDLMCSENLVLKKINGTQVTGRELFKYFKVYTDIFKSNKLPELKSIFEATTETSNQAAVREAFDHYESQMKLVCSDDKLYIGLDAFGEEHDRYQEEAVQLFRSRCKMGGQEKSCVFEEQLRGQIGGLFSSLLQCKCALLESAELHNDAAFENAMNIYRTNMEFVCRHDQPYVDPETLKEKHDGFKQEAVKLFQSKCRMVGEEKITESLKELRLRLDKSFGKYTQQNSKKKPSPNVDNILLGVCAAGGTVGFVAIGVTAALCPPAVALAVAICATAATTLGVVITAGIAIKRIKGAMAKVKAFLPIW